MFNTIALIKGVPIYFCMRINQLYCTYSALFSDEVRKEKPI